MFSVVCSVLGCALPLLNSKALVIGRIGNTTGRSGGGGGGGLECRTGSIDLHYLFVFFNVLNHTLDVILFVT